ncbi:MAG: class I SAM-dependent methyltransferase [Eubacterium sp.]|nr:class I SAM-dependent methyltransferase [Eubacterium sp.]
MNEKEKYAKEWNESAIYFYNNNYYDILSSRLHKDSLVLEIGCGTGFSTLALLEAGHSVIAVDNNFHCISKAKRLISSKGFSVKDSVANLEKNEVCFIQADITESDFESTVLPSINCDIVICWNIGTAWSEKMIKNLIPKMRMFNYPLNLFYESPESAYCELVIWHSCKIAKAKKCPIYIVDRGVKRINRYNDTYYCKLKKEFLFKKIKYYHNDAKTLSKGGRQLITSGVINTESELPIVLISVIMSN